MKRILLGVMTLMLAGCPAPGAKTADRVSHVPVSNAVLEIIPEFLDGSYLTLGEIKPYTRTDIKQLKLELFRLEKDGDTWKMPTAVDDSNYKVSRIDTSQLNHTIRFASLRPNTQYRIRWYAYDATSESAIAISEPGSRDIAIGIEESVTVAKLTIKLKDRAFNATATLEGIEVIDGGHTYSGPETIVVETP